MHPKVKELLEKEIKRQNETIDLIPSENIASQSVREAVGSVFMHKYSEGYPGGRYYEGNEIADEVENLAREMILKVMIHDQNLRESWHANVQPLSGSAANLGAYNSVLNPGDKILSMYLPDGGHLTHGWSYTPKLEVRSNKSKVEHLDSSDSKLKTQNSELVYRGGSTKVSIISKIFNVVQYKTDPETNLFDYDFIEKLAIEEKPEMIITGGTAYPRNIDYKRISEIAKKVGAYYLADVAHEAGLIAGGVSTEPFEYADFVTFTTHKTFRGPRGAVIMCRKEFAEQLDKSVMPGLQGGPFMHNILGILQALYEIDTPEFNEYSKQIVVNAKLLAEELSGYGFKVISGGTDKHLVLCDVLSSKGIAGRFISKALAEVGIISNKNTVPYEKGSPINPSGVRFGTPSITTRGMKENEVREIAKIINEVTKISKEAYQEGMKLKDFTDAFLTDGRVEEIKKKVKELAGRFPISN